MTLKMITMTAWMTNNSHLPPDVFLTRAREEGYETFVVLRSPSTLDDDEVYTIAKVANSYEIDKRSIDELIRYYR